MAVDKNAIKQEFFNADGRINRQKFWINTLILFGISIVANILVAILASIIAPLAFLIWPISIIITVASFFIAIRRLHDLNQTGWLSLLYLLPVVNLLFFLYLGIVPGTKGDNKYGADPLVARG